VQATSAETTREEGVMRQDEEGETTRAEDEHQDEPMEVQSGVAHPPPRKRARMDEPFTAGPQVNPFVDVEADESHDEDDEDEEDEDEQRGFINDDEESAEEDRTNDDERPVLIETLQGLSISRENDPDWTAYLARARERAKSSRTSEAEHIPLLPKLWSVRVKAGREDNV
ncbi:hypothetical protein H0H92_015309, partial [Tricholoma furcatifolium]